MIHTLGIITAFELFRLLLLIIITVVSNHWKQEMIKKYGDTFDGKYQHTN